MAIDKKIINFKKGEDFTREYNAGNILDKSLVFIDDTHEIVTHKTVFDGNIPDWNANEGQPGFIKNKPDLSNVGGSDDSVTPYPNANQIVYTTTDGEVCVLWDSTTVKENVYYKSKGYGIVTFNSDLTIVPRFCGYKSDDDKHYGTNIKTVVLPDNVTGFAEYCFNFDGKCLESINIPEGVTEIPAYCFAYTYSLFNLYLPSTVKTIGNQAFAYSAIKSIDLSNIETIGEYTFQYCWGLNTVNLTNLKTLGRYAFQRCYNLISYSLLDNYQLTEISQGAFYYCGLINIEITNNITKIGNSAFSNNQIKNVVINQNYQGLIIERNAFYGGYNIINNIILKGNSALIEDFENTGLFNSGYDGPTKIYVNNVEGYKAKYPKYKYCFHPLEGADVYVYKDNLWTGTQEQYDGITSKDSNTFYFIKED